MPNERLIRDTGGFIDLESDWGRGRRGNSLTSAQVRLICSGKPETDAIFAKLFGRAVLSIREVRRRARYRSVSINVDPTPEEISEMAEILKQVGLIKKLDAPQPKPKGDWQPQVYRIESPPEEENSP